jgi:23S rRNA (cytidine2498-2'-O)-methyltransferase
VKSAFLYVCCQAGAEDALKKEFAREHPELRFAYSRPGFVTFKHGAGEAIDEGFAPRSVFARACGLSLGKAREAAAIVEAARKVAAEKNVTRLRLHAWERDQYLPGDEPKGFVPGERGRALEAALRAAGGELFAAEARAQAGDSVFDAVWVGEQELWYGYHPQSGDHAPVPGGRFPVEVPADAPSRAYLKLEEAIAWSGAPLRPGDLAVEIGSAPGGASLALLRRGLKVVGIDPAEMSPLVARDPGFTHLRAPVAEVRREDLPEKVDWLLLDMNVAPQVTLYAVDRLASRMKDSLLGVMLTVKLNEWSFADEIPSWLEHVRAMGLSKVRATQLAGNRREILVYGLSRKGSTRR